MNILVYNFIYNYFMFQNENATLKKEIMVLKSKIALLERELLGDRKTQLLYVINS